MTGRDAQLRERLMATFKAEAEELSHVLMANLNSMAQGASGEAGRQLVESTFRSAHTLKGAARSVGMRQIESLCQSIETILRGLTRDEVQLSPSLISLLTEGVRGVSHLLAGDDAAFLEPLVARLDAVPRGGQPGPDGADASSAVPPMPEAQAEASAARPAITPDTLRVARSKLDALFFQSEEFLLHKLRAAERRRSAEVLAEVLTQCQRDGNAADIAAAVSLVQQLVSDLRADERDVVHAVDALHRETRQLRLAPASVILNVFPGMVVDLCAEQGKVVDLAIQGSEIEVDLQILEAVKDPLIHLVRNAVDHGIEAPPARQRAGKSDRGRIDLSVGIGSDGRVEFSVRDDGAGIDPAKVRAAAVRGGFLKAESAEALADDAAVDLLFLSGLSTSSVITQISGHGLGLAIVRERVEALGGSVRVESQVGVGTSIRLALPANVATLRGLLVRAGGSSFLIPLDAVQRIIRADEQTIQRAEGRDVMVLSNRDVVPVAALAQLLSLPGGTANGRSGRANGQATPSFRDEFETTAQLAVLLKVADQSAVVLVDAIEGDRDVLVKEMRPPMARVRHVQSAGLLGSGELVLNLRPGDLIRSVRSKPSMEPRRASEDESPPPLILAADDSITTRSLMRNILEAAGYRVRVAVDGMDAWTTLKSERCDLLVSDVDMPRMNGFELTARVRRDPALESLPVVLVTALDSREDKERGIEAGANAYVVKSDMEQSNLLEIIRRLVDSPSVGGSGGVARR
ncbi:MAG TPA: response regulator [Chloroflexota bacterium]|nr:response regulator [Chloroflexota bacterium]